MKKIAFLFFITFQGLCQNFDLANISNGENLYFRALFDKDESLYGYISLYDLGNNSPTEKTFEFFVFDKNLNQVLSNKIKFIKEITYLSPYINLDNDLILIPLTETFKGNNFIYPKSKRVNLKTNTIEDYNHYCFEDNTFIDCPENKSYRETRKEYKKNKKEKEFIEDSDVFRLKNNKFLVISYKDYFKYTKDNELKYFDENQKEIWTFKYNENGSKKESEVLRILDYNDDKIFAIIKVYSNYEIVNFILILDIKTGNVIKKEFVGHFDKSYLDRYGNNAVIKENENYLFIFNYLLENELDFGYALTKINKKTDEIKHHKIYYKNDLKKFLPNISQYGVVENGYQLIIKDVFFMEDGSVKILTEKFKSGGQFSKMKTTDMIFISTDADFKIEIVQTLEKEKSKNQFTDYLFSQEINNKKDFVFFYKDFQKDDETKDSNWKLFINTLINGNFKQEEVTISSKNDKYLTIPYVAKEGYILLREYNEKERYNQIRLERLNF